jgi:serine/threonine protein kinase
MTSGDGDTFGREQRVNEALAEYLAAVDAGQPPDRAEFLARHAEMAAELETFFADRDRFQQLARPLGSDAPTVAPSEPSGVSRRVAAPGDRVRYFGDYELLEEIARGGMGVVFRARQVSLDRVVALKMILAGQLASAADVQRFHTEAKAAANLKHPGIVAIHEIGEHEGQHFFSMDYVAGKSLAALIRENPLPAARAARYVQQVAEAIQHAHQHGTLHRDVKPSNVLIDAADQPHVTDFGLAKRLGGDAGLTMTGQLLGTPSYMSPEQAAGRPEQVGPSSDIYSLGAMLYELLTGRPPFRAESVLDTVMQVVNTEPVPPRLLNPKVPRELDTICLKCLEKDVVKRYASAQDLADDLGRYLAGEPIRARPPSVPFVVRHWLRQNLRATDWTMGVGLAAGLVMAIPTFFSAVGTSSQPNNLAITLSFRLPGEAGSGTPLPLPGWLMFASPLVIFGVGAFQGFFAALLVRPANRAADVAVGAASGMVAGLIFFTLAVGPEFIQGSIRQSNSDLALLERLAANPALAPDKADDPIAAQYPQWSSLDRIERCRLLREKINMDLRANGARALWTALVASLLTVPFGVIMALAGGQVSRGEHSLWATLWDYDASVHIISVGAFLLAPVVFGVLALVDVIPAGKPWWFLLHTLPLFALSALEGRHRKQFGKTIWRSERLMTLALLLSVAVGMTRFVVDLTDLLAGDTKATTEIIQNSDGTSTVKITRTISFALEAPWPWYVDVLVYAMTLALIVRYLAKQRPMAPP